MSSTRVGSIFHNKDEEAKDERHPLLWPKMTAMKRLRTSYVIAKYPDKDINIAMSDSNVKIGHNNTGYEEVMGG